MRASQAFDTLEYYKKITQAGLSDTQARIMVRTLKDVENIINHKDKDLEDDYNEIQCNKLLK